MRVRALVAAVAMIGLALPMAVAQSATTADAAQVSPSAAITPLPDGVTRLSGATRYETAVAVSQRYAPGVPVAFVATGADFPDALSAAAAAAVAGGPLLLTQSTKVPDAVRVELGRLKPGRIVVVGGAGVVSAGVVATLHGVAPTSRISGRDRYATGLGVVRSTFTGGADHAIIATGRSFPDALAATGAAGARQAPVILVDGAKSTVPAATLTALTQLGVSSVSIAGGTGVVSRGIQSQLANSGFQVTRHGGASRFDTAALINRAYFPANSATTSFLATGLDFPDALAAGALAGHLAAPLYLTPRNCADHAVSDAITELGAPSRAVMGGTAIVSNAAAANARCVYPVTGEPLDDWTVSGVTLRADVAAPYSDRPPVDVHDPSIRLDSTGLLIYLRRDTGTRSDHPVAYAQYAISALLEHERTGDSLWLERAIRHGQRLIDIHVERSGAWWFPYKHPWTYLQRTMTPPWYSGMAQGEALSLFVRLAEATGQSKWDVAADRTWQSFAQPHSTTAPWSSLVIDRHLYFEEFAGKQIPLLVLNGHLFATFGLYDYWRHTGNAEVARYIDGAVTTVANRMVPLIRVEGGVSYYCVQADYCQIPRWQSEKYHVIHSWQFDTVARITGDARFSTWAEQLRADWSPATAAPFTSTGSDWMAP
ncbi:cell wall-binding repeat-containing protein [Agromyces humatus]|uniref:D-glucuronyl C5-epimerase C-terminal domain-containing protein n=1 Tax=Agromyces humatus TaxID=279573 RepID=A0ABP4WE09_9MICO|nr:cell wall-binding repeat-containing protein [Agromyces humatus]